MFDAPLTSEILADTRSVELSRSPLAADPAVFPLPSSARQHTLRSSISCTGVGLHSGTKTTLTLHPADIGAGIAFRRTDKIGGGAMIPALWSNVSDTRLNTCISNGDHVSVRTIEHLMAALAGMGVDNAVIEIDGEEVPVMDGSAAPFVFLIECAGLVEQSAPRQVIKLLKPILLRDGDKMAALRPAEDFTLSVDIDFAAAAIGRQQVSLTVERDAFKSEISRARTFGFEQEVEAMRAAGLGRGGSLDNAVVISGDGSTVLNQDGLRYDNEFVRHKLLDALGDLSLAGAPLLAEFHGSRTGHALNNRLLRAMFADSSAWVRVPVGLSASVDLPRSLHRSTRLVAAASM
jgi:UDP-3-O-[3-hydroxymyristoyl] N-acetylglucosamine deacetylase